MSRRVGILGVLACAAAMSCAAPADAQPGGHDTAIVVIHHKGELAPQLAEPDLELLRQDAVAADHGGAEVYIIAAGRAATETVDIVGRRPNGSPENGPRRVVLVEERLGVVKAAVLRAAREVEDADVLRALDEASRSGARRLIVLTAGLSTTDPLDLRIAGFDQDPAALADHLRRSGALPDLAGLDVIFSGLGRTEDPQPSLGVREQARLRGVWMAVCQTAGGTCRIEDAARPAEPALSPLPAQVVAVATPTTMPGPDGEQIVSVPATLLFAPDSCTVDDRTAAAGVLAPLATRLRGGGFVVSISGRTAPVGPGTGADLATCRAQAAADLLRADLQVPAEAIGEIRGDGSLLDPPEASRDAAGRLDPSKLPGLRRVVFTVTSTEG